MKYTYQEKTFTIDRYPTTDNKSLQAWSAADEHILNYLEEEKISCEKAVIYNDRFGFLSTILADKNPTAIIDFKSQEKAFAFNFEDNGLEQNLKTNSSIDELKGEFDLALIKIPKSLDLFRLQLAQAQASLSENGQVICGFMTKYFSKQYLTIAAEYFEDCSQSKAWKKSRVLILKGKKAVEKENLITEIQFSGNKVFKQHYGVFSAKYIDHATQFFIDHMDVRLDHNKILDLGSGNGVLAYAALEEKPQTEIHLIDDSLLAIESSKMNVEGENVHFHYNDSLADLEDHSFDLVVSNPPFHFEHETNIEVALELFKEVKRVLKKGGSFQMVTSNHLNSKTHLYKLFHKVDIVSQDLKFVVYNCH
tara:strand:+ start:640 stop:1731 length:1092 start_codon:yes stop_codon:yes gene_type:complete